MSKKNYYLKLKLAGSDIKGESTNDKHEDQIEILGYSTNMHQPTSSGTGKIVPDGHANFGEFLFTKPLDVSSPKLYLGLAKGQIVDEAVFELCRTSGDQICFMKYTFKNGFISSVSTSSVEDSDIPVEVVGIRYTEIEWEYKQLNPDDFKEKTTVSHNFDCSKNKGA